MLPVKKYRAYYVINANRIWPGRTRYGNFPTKEAAEREAAKLWARHTLGEIGGTGRMSVDEAASRYRLHMQARVEEREISQSHADQAMRSLGPVLDVVAGKRLGSYDTADLGDARNKSDVAAAIRRSVKATGLAKATCETRLKAARAFFQFCLSHGWMAVNPLAGVTLGMSSDISDRAPRIQPETIRKVVAALDDEPLRNRAIVLFSLATGCRQGETRALQWQDIDLDRMEVRIERAVKHMSQEIGDTKTKRGRRVLPLPEQVVGVLKELKIASRYSQPGDLVFCSESGAPRQKKTLHNLMLRVCDRAGIERLRWGDMRHYYASVQLSELGEDWAEVAQLMGHSSPNFTYRQYGHYSRNERKQERARAAVTGALFG